MSSRLMAIVAVAAVYLFGIGSLVLIVIGATGLANGGSSDSALRAESARSNAPVRVVRHAINDQDNDLAASPDLTGMTLADRSSSRRR